MSRKALPKAITRPLDDLQSITTDEPRKKPELVSIRTTPRDAETPTSPVSPPVSMTARALVAPAARSPTVDSEVLPALPARNDPEVVSIKDDPQAARRRAVARKIVDRHRLWAAAGGLFPLVAVNVAGVTAINMRMVKVLSNLYGVPFERDRVRSIILACIGGAAPSGLAVATASTLALVAPGGALVGLAVSSFSAAALTRGIGSVFIERLEQAVQDKS